MTEHSDDGELRPCTCTNYCDPRAMGDDRYCRERASCEEADASSSEDPEALTAPPLVL